MPSRPTKATAPPKPKTIRLTFKQQLELCEQKQQNPKLSAMDLVDWSEAAFRLPKRLAEGTVWRILRRRDKLLRVANASGKRFNSDAFTAFDERLAAELARQAASSPGVIAGAEIIKLAKQVADAMAIPPSRRPKFSKGWLDRFRKRHLVSPLATGPRHKQRIEDEAAASDAMVALGDY